MVSKAQVLSASNPDLRDIMTLQASGVPTSIYIYIYTHTHINKDEAVDVHMYPMAKC